MSELRIDGIIGEGNGTATKVSDFLAMSGDNPTLVINSPGGNAVEGAAILAIIERHGTVNIRIEGVAASAASLIAMGGKTIIIHPAALMMIHEPASFSFGTAADHRDNATALDKMTEVYAAAYARGSGHPVAIVRDWMADETWMTAEDAETLGFCDAVDAINTTQIQACAYDYQKFRNAPAVLCHIKKPATGNSVLSRLFQKGKSHA